MKYIPAKKLIAEIERLKERYGSITLKSITAQNYQEGRLIGYEDALYEIKKLFQQVQSDNKDIDKIAQEFYEHLYELKRRNNVPTNLYDKQEIIDIWKDGIEYGRNHPKQEQPECIYGRTPEEREKCCKFCSAICEARIEQEQPELPGIEEPGIPGKDFIPVEWVDACEMFGKWKIVKQEQPEVDLEKFTDKIKTFQGRYKYPEIVSIKGAMAFMARMFYQYPNVARLWYDRLPKTTMD